MPRLRSALLALLLPALLAACGDDPASTRGVEGALRFSYDGSDEGRFSARGTVTTTWGPGGFGPGSYAAALRDTILGDTVLYLVATQEGRETGDMLALTLAGATHAAAYPVTDYCGPIVLLPVMDTLRGAPPERCASGMLVLGLPLRSGPEEGRFYLLQSGTLRVTELTRDRLRGTFEADAREFSLELDTLWVGQRQAGTPPALPDTLLHLRGGSFDVPIVDMPAHTRPTWMLRPR